MRITGPAAATFLGFSFTASTNLLLAWALSGALDKAHYLEIGFIWSCDRVALSLRNLSGN
jgi:hypothetical protein